MTADLAIRPSDLTEPDVIGLLTAHFENMRAISPPDACFVLDLDGLRSPEVQMLAAWRGMDLAAIGALKHHTGGLFEVKSMRAADAHRGTGAGRAILTELIEMARMQGGQRLALETGTTEHFAASRGLYAAFGFAPCGPFAGYGAHPHSLFMSRTL